MSTTWHLKLVRNLIPDIIRQQGLVPEVRKVEANDGLRALLLRKVGEETGELANANVQAHVCMEAADVLEAVLTYVATWGIGPTQVENMRQQRRKERGVFDGTCLVSVTDPNP